MKRFPLVLLVWLGCGFAWIVLGTSLVVRTGQFSSQLLSEVRLLWGPEISQRAPSASYEVPRTESEVTRRKSAAGTEVEERKERVVMESVELPLEASELAARLALQHRRKGLLWFPTYRVDFRGRYTFANAGDAPREASLACDLGDQGAIYDGFRVTDEKGAAVPVAFRGSAAHWNASFAPREARAFTVSYRSRGTSKWTYRLTDGASQVKNFRLAVSTDFPRVDFAPGSVSPTRHRATGTAWEGDWRFESLVANAPIGIVMPEKLNPGPLASRITFFAPVGLLFFFFVVAILCEARRVPIHPMNYFFFGCAFFAFHLLFAYLVDHLAILPSFLIASGVSVLLVVTYARLFTGWSFALRVLGAAQFLYLVLFSLTFFWEGFTGLAISVGAVLTLFVMMQVTGRMEWGRLEEPAAPAPVPGR